jgi:hypothetical protein
MPIRSANSGLSPVGSCDLVTASYAWPTGDGRDCARLDQLFADVDLGGGSVAAIHAGCLPSRQGPVAAPPAPRQQEAIAVDADPLAPRLARLRPLRIAAPSPASTPAAPANECVNHDVLLGPPPECSPPPAGGPFTIYSNPMCSGARQAPSDSLCLPVAPSACRIPRAAAAASAPTPASSGVSPAGAQPPWAAAVVDGSCGTCSPSGRSPQWRLLHEDSSKSVASAWSDQSTWLSNNDAFSQDEDLCCCCSNPLSSDCTAMEAARQMDQRAIQQEAGAQAEPGRWAAARQQQAADAIERMLGAVVEALFSEQPQPGAAAAACNPGFCGSTEWLMHAADRAVSRSGDWSFTLLLVAVGGASLAGRAAARWCTRLLAPGCWLA